MWVCLSDGHSLSYWSWFRGVVLLLDAAVGVGGEFTRAVNLLLVETGFGCLLGLRVVVIVSWAMSRVAGCSLRPNIFLAHLAATWNASGQSFS